MAKTNGPSRSRPSRWQRSRAVLRSAAAALGLLAILVLGGGPAAAQELTLPLPPSFRPGDTAWVEVEVGPVGRREVTIATASGQVIGVISPFGPRAGQV